MTDYFEIGQIVNTFGIKGMVKIKPFTENLEQFEELERIYIKNKKSKKEYKIQEVKYHKQMVIIKFEGVENPEEADLLRGSYVLINRKDAKPLEEGTYYIVDLLGLEVYTDENILLGKVEDIYNTGSKDIYVVKDNLGKQVLLPGIEDVIKKVDLENKKIISNLDDDLKLYAIYESKSTSVSNNPKKRTLWLVADGSDNSNELPIFHNEKYFKLHKEDKVIYPGATGSYIMNFTNDSKDTIVIKGIKLVEDTICIEKNGCLNMGYIIKYSPPSITKETIYYYGKENNYKILNKDVDPRNINYKGKQINFKDYKGEITLKSKEKVTIPLLWKWVEIDEDSDKLDTLIGNQAADSEYDETLNDKYKISIGLDIEIYNNKCNQR